jgi:hypothetical protein
VQDCLDLPWLLLTLLTACKCKTVLIFLDSSLLCWQDVSVRLSWSALTPACSFIRMCYKLYFSSFLPWLTRLCLMLFISLIGHEFACRNTQFTKHMSNMCLSHDKHAFPCIFHMFNMQLMHVYFILSLVFKPVVSWLYSLAFHWESILLNSNKLDY